jgi:hypothetical protein
MKQRILMLLAVVALMVVMLAMCVAPAFARGCENAAFGSGNLGQGFLDFVEANSQGHCVGH